MHEFNFDGIVGPTHNYSGLSYGNIASMDNKDEASNPKQAALQGLEKMKFLSELGIRQAVLPPHERPHIPTLKALGFEGADKNIPEKAFKVMPEILYKLSSAAPMWVANMATITPSSDSLDNRVHITPANLSTMFHRSIESETSAKILKAIFPDPIYFRHHPPLPQGELFRDEGAANNTRFCNEYAGMGVNLFVYGEPGKKFPARQTLKATQTLIRSHQLYPARVVIAQQNPEAIDAGIFHNDVISVSNQNLFLYHEKAFVESERVIDEIRKKLKNTSDVTPYLIQVPDEEVPLGLAVNTYLFNSQIVTLPDGTMSIIAPLECETNPHVREFLDKISKDPDSPIRDLHFLDLHQSMKNGGGPACLRLRVILNQKELNSVNQSVFLNEKLYNKLVTWVNKHYRDSLLPEDLADPNLVDEVQNALNELTQILNLGKIYDFQK